MTFHPGRTKKRDKIRKTHGDGCCCCCGERNKREAKLIRRLVSFWEVFEEELKMAVYQVAKFILIGAVVAVGAASKHSGILVRIPRQTHGKGNQQDQSSAETGFLGGGGVENSKYFHYQHLPEHDKYEFGHRRGNDHHVVERYEKAVPHEGQFKTKVRWADKKGGHGEHYWDYNHAGHGGEGNGQNNGDRNGGYSDPVPVYTPIHKASKQHQKRQLEEEKKIKLEDVDSSSEPSNQERTGFVDSLEKEIGGVESFDIQRESDKQKTNPTERKAISDDSHLFFDLNTGKVIDELTGKKYILQPVN